MVSRLSAENCASASVPGLVRALRFEGKCLGKRAADRRFFGELFGSPAGMGDVAVRRQHDNGLCGLFENGAREAFGGGDLLGAPMD